MSGIFKQFKLTNADELICELIEPAGEDHAEIIVRKAMKIVIVDDYDMESRYYTFKPWIAFQDTLDDLSALNSEHIVGEATPSETVMTHYVTAMAEVERFNKLKQTGMDINQIADMVQDMSKEDMEEFLQSKFGDEPTWADEDKKDDVDSTDSKIIQFKPKNTTRH